MTNLGIIERRRLNAFPGPVDFDLTRTGKELVNVAKVLSAWLAAAPDGPIAIGSPAAKSVVKAFIEGWNTNVLRALAAKPFTLTELNGLITRVSYPSLERRLAAMRLACQIEKLPVEGRGSPYVVTRWLREAVAPLIAAVRWERTNLKDQSSPVGARDAEAAFLLAVPLLRLPEDATGSCRMAVEIGSSDGHTLAGVMVSVKGGHIAQCASRLQGDADSWATGTPLDWLAAVISQDMTRLESGGDVCLAAELVAGLHTALFRSNGLAVQSH